MSPIKNIGNLPPEFRRAERNEKQSQLKKSDDSTARGPTKADQAQKTPQDFVNVSDSARTMLQRDAEVQQFKAEMPFIETLSSEEREDIEAKIDSGFYSSPEAISAVAGKIDTEFSVNQSDMHKQKITPTRMQEVIEKIRTSQYDSAKVLDTISDRIIKDL